MVERGEWGTAWGILLKLIFCARDTNRQLNSPTNSERRKPERSSHPAILKKITKASAAKRLCKTKSLKLGADKNMKKLFNDLIFKCRKCEHLLYIMDGMEKTGQHLKNVLRKTDCPECGEEAEELWIFVRNGNFYKEIGSSDD